MIICWDLNSEEHCWTALLYRDSHYVGFVSMMIVA